MDDLLWFSGITWGTPIRDIGWTYIVLMMLGGALALTIRSMVKTLRGDS